MVLGRGCWSLWAAFLNRRPVEDLRRLGSLSGVAKAEPYFRRFAELGARGRYESATILGLQSGSRMKATVITAGRDLSGDGDEVIVSHDLARRLTIRVGDAVTVRIPSGQEFARRVVAS